MRGRKRCEDDILLLRGFRRTGTNATNQSIKQYFHPVTCISVTPGSIKHIGDTCQFECRNDWKWSSFVSAMHRSKVMGDENGQVVSMMMNSNPISVHGDGSQTRSLTWVGDLVTYYQITNQDGLSVRHLILTREEISTDLAKNSITVVLNMCLENQTREIATRIPDVDEPRTSEVTKYNLDEGLAQLMMSCDVCPVDRLESIIHSMPAGNESFFRRKV